MSVSFSISGLPAPEDAVLVMLGFEGTKCIVLANVRSDEHACYEEFDRIADARAALERIIEPEPDQWVAIFQDVYVRKPAMRSARAEDEDYFSPPYRILFTWDTDDDAISVPLGFATRSSRDRALRAYEAVSFISEAEAYCNRTAWKCGR